MLDENVMWVGPPNKREAARRLLAVSNARILGSRNNAKLHSITTFKSAGQQTPGRTVGNIFSQIQAPGLSLICAPAVGKKKVSKLPQGLPLMLTVELLARQLKADWFAGKDWLMFATPEQIRMLRAAREQFNLSRLNGSLRSPAVAGFPSGKLKIQFLETPLRDVAEFFADLYDSAFVCSSSHAKTPVTCDFRDIDLFWGLTAVLSLQQLDFAVGEELIYIGARDQTARFAALELSRPARMKGLPPAFSKPVAMKKLEGDFSDVLRQAGKAIDVQLKLSAIGPRLRQSKVALDLRLMNACTLLDLLAADTGSSWEYRMGVVVFTAL